MPLLEGAEEDIRENLAAVARGDRPRMIAIAYLTDEQFSEINRTRREMNLPELIENTIMFLGKHIYASRSSDGYTIDDMVRMIVSALSQDASILLNRFKSLTWNLNGREDGYGNTVRDQGVLEIASRLPRAELFSVIPKGDDIKPQNAQRPA